MARFDSLKELTKEQLIELKKELEEDIEYCKDKLEDNRLTGDDKVDTRNDIDFDNASIRAIDKLLEEEETKKKM